MISKKDISIVIADDHPMLLKGLYDELTIHNYQVTGKAANGMQALEQILTLEPTLALLDIDMPLLNGFEVIKTASEKKVSTKFIILSFLKETKYITQAKKLGIDGYLLKEDSFFEIEKCIREILQGNSYFSKAIDSSSLQNASEELKKLQFLTPSETTILKLIAQQISTIEIADSLFVSKRTIEKHRSNIISKLELGKETNTLTKWTLNHKNVILEL
ncbi:response regulator [Aquimarina litoralis]|uniref:response regulator n=1 Tax=Aquimarina litoralis TaxID=584605 RepID=UPI001C57DBA9|nr:response regulator transcription factor [Aquimarina litoralis]MBW1294198.1 response regulator [Aquimarina litoralis]